MPNRAERRAQAKQNRRGVPQQYDQTRGRGRSGMLDEYQLQEKSRRLQDGTEDVQGAAFRAPVVPRGQRGADRIVRNRIPCSHVAAIASDVAHRNRFHCLCGRCA